MRERGRREMEGGSEKQDIINKANRFWKFVGGTKMIIVTSVSF